MGTRYNFKTQKGGPLKTISFPKAFYRIPQDVKFSKQARLRLKWMDYYYSHKKMPPFVSDTLVYQKGHSINGLKDLTLKTSRR
jgi:hypothetical protein